MHTCTLRQCLIFKLQLITDTDHALLLQENTTLVYWFPTSSLLVSSIDLLEPQRALNPLGFSCLVSTVNADDLYRIKVHAHVCVMSTRMTYSHIHTYISTVIFLHDDLYGASQIIAIDNITRLLPCVSKNHCYYTRTYQFGVKVLLPITAFEQLLANLKSLARAVMEIYEPKCTIIKNFKFQENSMKHCYIHCTWKSVLWPISLMFNIM